ncbi:MAG: hypothetical protein KatS3mg131_0865 [Candidatus Tectimicrobiota bacterium]|nr:MAG: hypothetical protein KatS3mg131_0865 [Candidatus Tectomicrobia bacterium]
MRRLLPCGGQAGWWGLVLSLGLGLLASGCGGRQPLPPSVPLTTAGPLWQQLHLRRQAFQSLQGLVRLQLRAPGQRLALDTAAVVMRGFEALRLEGLGPFGQPLFLLILAEQQLWFYTPQERTLVVGAATEDSLVRLLGIALSPRVVPYVLIGDLPLETLPAAGTVAYLAAEGHYRWQGTLPQRAGRYAVWFDAASWQPVRFETYTPSGVLALRITYDDFRPSAPFTVPHRIALTQPLASRHLVWHYSEVQMNVEVSPALFHMRVPAGTRRLSLEQLSGVPGLPSTSASAEDAVSSSRQNQPRADRPRPAS